MKALRRKKKPVKKKMRHTASTMKRLTLMKKRIHRKPTRTKKNLIVRWPRCPRWRT